VQLLERRFAGKGGSKSLSGATSLSASSAIETTGEYSPRPPFAQDEQIAEESAMTRVSFTAQARDAGADNLDQTPLAFSGAVARPSFTAATAVDREFIAFR